MKKKHTNKQTIVAYYNNDVNLQSREEGRMRERGENIYVYAYVYCSKKKIIHKKKSEKKKRIGFKIQK